MEDVAGDAVADELVYVLGQELPLGGLDLEVARRPPPEQDHQQSAYDRLQQRLVEPLGRTREGRAELEVVHTGGRVTAPFQRKKSWVHSSLPYLMMIK